MLLCSAQCWQQMCSELSVLLVLMCRAENSNTTRHLAEFWMIEPELAFATLEDDMNCAEDYVRHCCKVLLETCP